MQKYLPLASLNDWKAIKSPAFQGPRSLLSYLDLSDKELRAQK